MSETDGKDLRGSLHGFLNTLLSPYMDINKKEEILTRDYGMIMEYELEKELRQMCNLSEAIEEKALQEGFEKGILLTKKVLKLSAEGMNDTEIAETCEIPEENVRAILEA